MHRHGPFSGLLGFSEGASVAATILIEDTRCHDSSLGIECAIFFCGAPPVMLGTNESAPCDIRAFDAKVDGVLVRIPTAHIWSESGDWFPGMGRDLAALCDKSLREDVVHALGHDVPGSTLSLPLAPGATGASPALPGTGWRESLRAIERTIEKATLKD
jgi:hypothetical protein